MPTETAVALRVSERMLLFCVASNTDWKHSAIPGEIVTTMVVKGLIDRDAGGALTLTDRGRAVLRQCCRTFEAPLRRFRRGRRAVACACGDFSPLVAAEAAHVSG
jgi:hypothetical protein